jgi:hypothetical protein
MTCEQCANITEYDAANLHVVRPCPGCGRPLRHKPTAGKHGRGIKLSEGALVFPSEELTIAINPLKSKGTLTPYGIELLATQLFFPVSRNAEEYEVGALEIERELDEIVNNFAPAVGLDVNCAEDLDRLKEVMSTHRETPAYWAWVAAGFSASRRDATERGALAEAVWSAAVSERARAMWAYKCGLEDVVRMGHSARRLLDALNMWNNQRTNSDELFWQQEFKERQFILSLVFGVPVVLLEDQAYLGGMTLDRTEAKLADYLFTVEGSRQAIVIEIKTPTATLMNKGKYRKGVYTPHRDLTGAVAQVLAYRTELMKRIETRRSSSGSTLGHLLPRCAVVVGDTSVEFKDADGCQRSFEEYRASQKDVEVIGYDELFRKVALLGQLFGLQVNQSG